METMDIHAFENLNQEARMAFLDNGGEFTHGEQFGETDEFEIPTAPVRKKFSKDVSAPDEYSLDLSNSGFEIDSTREFDMSTDCD